MRRGLWLIRLLLLVAVSAVVMSPLVVHGEASTPHPIDLEYDVSALALPSSPTYPAVTAYREVRLALSDGQCQKARASLSFANDDVAAIMEMVKREQYTEAAQHSDVFRESFDLSVGWTVIAGQNQTNVSSLLGQLKNDHIGQQAILAQATSAGLPLWAKDSLEETRQHAAMVLLEAIGLLQGYQEADAYRRTMVEVCPDLDLGENEPRIEVGTQEDTGKEPEDDIGVDIVVVTREDERDTKEATGTSANESMPDIASMSLSPSVLAPGETSVLSCNVASGSPDDLEYIWSSDDGELDVTGATTVWTAPSGEGTYTISVTIRDSSGNSDSASIEAHVRDAAAVEDDTPDSLSPPVSPAPDESVSPEILGISVNADHKYLSHNFGDSYSILVGRSCTITCEVGDPDSVSFKWTANGGEISGEGDTITWESPKVAGNLKVTVTVTNGEGREDSAELSFYCTNCSPCF